MEKRDNTPGYLAVFRVMDQLGRLMEKRSVKKAELAKRMGVKAPAVSRWFTPGRNLTIFTAAAIAHALGAELRISIVERSKDGSQSEKSVLARRSAPPPEMNTGVVAVVGTASFLCTPTRGRVQRKAAVPDDLALAGCTP